MPLQVDAISIEGIDRSSRDQAHLKGEGEGEGGGEGEGASERLGARVGLVPRS